MNAPIDWLLEGGPWIEYRTRLDLIESVWTAWKDWEFGQKKEPSRWLTLSAWRIIRYAQP